MVNIPAPVGGTALPADFAPSIVFAILYALIAPFMIYRVLLKRRSRTLLLIGTVIFSIERVVVFSLRAAQSRSEEKRFSHGLLNYMQISFGLGFIGIANDLINIIKCLMINPTYGSDMFYQSPAANTKEGVFKRPPEGTPDRPKLRFWLRRWADLLNLAFFAASLPGSIFLGQYSKTFDDQNKANSVQRFRSVSAGVALCLCILVIITAVLCRIKLHTPRRSISFMIFIASLMSIVAIYRLSIMSIKTTSITVQTSLDEPGQKALFYIFHALPEWLAITSMVMANVRKWFGTGLAGDYLGRDWNEKQVKRYEAKQAKKDNVRSARDESSDAIPLKEKKSRLITSEEQV
ncbi:hypothetical protein CPB84DRAFT_1678411 [Gymnopilus junonius]|uniref:Uncharacterized protein n=1 Tax=Gymnopilus junonius TaxID=109634 RepID=A0A9P5NQJ9_GYMJU|nr:hypothetical protein CPB84DRAFT_1678411 [Gymnopilus junonius]